jgi:trimeric autotransporter adhesin
MGGHLDGDGIYAVSNLYAGIFGGDVVVQGNLSKSSGSFKIDHPLDPANKYLYHSFVESPDMMNIYNGVATLDANGEAVIQMPEWFGVLNRDFRYQLTCIGGFAPVYIAEELANNQFKIGGGRAEMRVSWQITGIRQDAWANAHRIPVEEE